MSGVVIARGPCIACGRLFWFNPLRVPSFDGFTGKREPICHSCMDRVNARRAAMGFEPHPILDGAYDALPEGELP